MACYGSWYGLPLSSESPSARSIVSQSNSMSTAPTIGSWEEGEYIVINLEWCISIIGPIEIVYSSEVEPSETIERLTGLALLVERSVYAWRGRGRGISSSVDVSGISASGLECGWSEECNKPISPLK
jgi:hypothetical protein